jgi:hypothetical protein
MRVQLTAFVTAIAVLSLCEAHAQNVDEKELDLALRSKTCPATTINPAHLCQEILAKCAAHVTWECDAEAHACGIRERDLNAKIDAYNSLYHDCRRTQQSRRETQDNKKVANTGESALSRALKAQTQKAQNVDQVNRIQRQQMDELRDAENREQARQARLAELAREQEEAQELARQDESCRNYRNSCSNDCRGSAPSIQFSNWVAACFAVCTADHELCLQQIHGNSERIAEARDAARRASGEKGRQQRIELDRRQQSEIDEQASEPYYPPVYSSPSGPSNRPPVYSRPPASTFTPYTPPSPRGGGSTLCGGPGCAGP